MQEEPRRSHVNQSANHFIESDKIQGQGITNDGRLVLKLWNRCLAPKDLSETVWAGVLRISEK